MNPISKQMVQKIIKHWENIIPYTQIPKNETEYEKLLAFIDLLMEVSRQKPSKEISSLVNFIAKNIAAYENRHALKEKLTPIEMLKFLMEEHQLAQNDLPEIGSQSLVSKILSGERQLTAEHIRKLAGRFNVSPTIFLG